MRREVAGIEELLEEEPDSRCESCPPHLGSVADPRSAGCLDSLVYYKRLLVSLLGKEEATREEREQLNLEALGMLQKLAQVDPMRKCRYQDLGAYLRSGLSKSCTDELLLSLAVHILPLQR